MKNLNKKSEEVSSFLREVYDILFLTYGPQGWWPLITCNQEGGFDKRGYHKSLYTSPATKRQEFEIIIGALLTQNTAWTNVEKALQILSEKNVLSSNAILQEDTKTLAEYIRSAGYFRQKAERLKGIAVYLKDHSDILKGELFNLRKELLSLKGIGPETADSIILYAAKKPIFVIDAYTKRIFSRIGLYPENVSYENAQNLFMTNLPHKTELFNEYHALLVELAKKHCKTKPDCNTCPLKKKCSFHLGKK